MKASEDVLSLVKVIDAPRTLVVGGWVRDQLLGLDSKDVDFEVYGLNLDVVAQRLQDAGHKVNLVGQQFGVLTVDNKYDVSVPRRDNKCGVGHTGFTVECDPTMTPKEAAARRDFTINALAFDPLTGEVLDFFNGQEDLMLGHLNATSEAFMEDPLRVLRGMQFAARFGMEVDALTLVWARKMADQFDTLSSERIYGEWKKWALKGNHPSLGLHLLEECNWLQCFPELEAMLGVEQEFAWHPEGCVLMHTRYVCDAAAEVADRENLNDFDREVLMFAALCHDMGKPETTELGEDGVIRSHRHAKAGVKHARSFLEGMKAPQAVVEAVCKLTQYHLFHANFKEKWPKPRTVRRLAVKLDPVPFRLWVNLVEADASGRPPMPPCSPAEGWLALAHQVKVIDSAPKPLVMGRHLLKLGVEPGPEMGLMLADLFEKQLDGEFETVAEGLLLWAKT